MGKNVRRGRTGNVRCASCGQITRRDRAVYLFRDGIKAYYCPDCAKKIHGQRLYKGMPKYVKRTSSPKVKRKFTIFAKEDIGDGISEVTEDSVEESSPENEYTENEQKDQEDSENVSQENNEETDKDEQDEQNQENNEQ